MAIAALTTADVAAVTGLPEANLGGVLGVEGDAIRDVKRVLTAEVWTAISEGSGAVNDERKATVVRAVARYAFARVAPTMGGTRPTDKGGFQRASGPESARVELLSPDQIARMCDRLRSEAANDLAALRDEVAGDSTADEIEPAPTVWFA